MYVTQLVNRNRHKVDIYLDGEYAFWLYPSEVKKLGIEEGADMSAEAEERIVEELVLPRAKEKMFELLAASDKSAYELKRKLISSGFTEDIAVQMCDYANMKHYIDEDSLAEQFIRNRMGRKSRRELMLLLQQKGISAETAEAAFERLYVETIEEDGMIQNPELIAIQKLLQKKCKDISGISDEELTKVKLSILRKGFRYEDIDTVVKKVKRWDNNN